MRTFLTGMTLALTLSVSAQLTMPRLFADHMVLQRDKPIKVWGWTSPKAKLTITFNGETKRIKSDDKGYFKTFLKPQKAGGPYTMSVSDNHTTLSFDDVLIGDVWIAGGQSNMEWKLQWGVNDWEEEVEDSDYPDIRFFQVPNEYASSVQRDVSGGEWLMANPENSPHFSAVAWFFAKRNHAEKAVPVGVVESNWGGTPAEAWTSIETLAHTKGYEEVADTIMHPSKTWEEIEQENKVKDDQKWKLMRDEQGAIASGAQKIAYDDSPWIAYELPCDCKMTDLAWLRREVQLAADSIKEVELYISNVVQEAFVFFNGELIWTKKWNEDIKPVPVDKALIRDGKNVITYRVANSWDGKVYFGRPEEMWLSVNGTRISLEGDWKYSNEIEPKLPMAVKMFQMPSFLYNSKIAPIAGYTSRGVIWYQGESNAGLPQYYRELFGNMINDWRSAWGDPTLPFLYVQLANFMQRKEQPEDSDWAQLREAQTQALDLPNTAMAVTIDIGDAQDIHPRNKQDVGYRLWLAARKVSFKEGVVYSGPQVQKAVGQANSVKIRFDHVGSGLVSKGALKGFAVSDRSGTWYWAEASILGDVVLVSSKQVSHPTAVSYAWGDNPEATLYNLEGLPAVPFRVELN